MKGSIAILVLVGLVAVFVENGYGAALKHHLVKRATSQTRTQVTVSPDNRGHQQPGKTQAGHVTDTPPVRWTGRTASPEKQQQQIEKTQAGHREVINELNERFSGYREGCFPKPRGCSCTEGGRDVRYMTDAECKGPIATTRRPGAHGSVTPARPGANRQVTTTKYVPSWRTTTMRTTTARRG